MEKLFTLFGEKATKTADAIDSGKIIKWTKVSVEGRTTLHAFID